MAYFIIDVEILGERITSCETRLIVRNENGVIEVIQSFFQRHDDGDWNNKGKKDWGGQKIDEVETRLVGPN